MISSAGEGNHGPESLLDDEMAGGESEAGGEDAVVGARGAATLEVAEDDAAGLVAGGVFDELGNGVTHPAQANVAEGVGLAVEGGQAAVGELGAFGDNDDAVVLPLVATPLEDLRRRDRC